MFAGVDWLTFIVGIDFLVPLAYPNSSAGRPDRSRLGLKRGSMPTLVPKKDYGSPPQVLYWLPLQGKRSSPPLQFELFDADYVGRLRAGDYRTQEHFCAYFSVLIQVKLRSRLKSRSSIEDVRQETFARFFVNLHAGKIQEPERLGAYVNSMCNHVLLEYYRHDAHHNLLEDESPQDLPDKGRGPVEILASKEQEKKVREILGKLPERDQRLLREIFLEERDKDDVCRDFGVTREYLRVLLHRAKHLFREWYLKDMGEYPST